MERICRVGTRTSPLALRQADEFLEKLRKHHRHFRYEITGVDTLGDMDKKTPISEVEGTDFFTRELDDAVLGRLADFAVHSAKDLPESLKAGLTLAALTSSIDVNDVLVSRRNLKLDELPYGAKIGASSLRRKTQLKEYRPDFRIVDIRGNIGERLGLMDETDLDAVVLAAAGLIRLGLKERITERIPLEIMKPHPLQGALAAVARSDDYEMIGILSAVDARTGVGV